MKSKVITWKGLKQESLETCSIKEGDIKNIISSTVIGLTDNLPFKVDYFIETNVAWETIAFEVTVQLANTTTKIAYHKDEWLNWFKNEKLVPELTGCTDIDISVTPFTNTLAIKHLSLEIGERRAIRVIYIDIFEQQESPVQQFYTRTGPTDYFYENVSNEFTSKVHFDNQDLVTSYPGLFQRLD